MHYQYLPTRVVRRSLRHANALVGVNEVPQCSDGSGGQFRVYRKVFSGRLQETYYSIRAGNSGRGLRGLQAKSLWDSLKGGYWDSMNSPFVPINVLA